MGQTGPDSNVCFVDSPFIMLVGIHRLIVSYPKPRGAIPDYTDPVVLRRSACTVHDFCDHIHKAIMKDFKWYVALFVAFH
jgi:ribosome-interacting GTPase 1